MKARLWGYTTPTPEGPPTLLYEVEQRPGDSLFHLINYRNGKLSENWKRVYADVPTPQGLRVYRSTRDAAGWEWFRFDEDWRPPILPEDTQSEEVPRPWIETLTATGTWS